MNNILRYTTTSVSIYNAVAQESESVAQSCLTLCDPMDCSPPGSSVLEDSPGKNTGVVYYALPQAIFPSGIESRSPALHGFFTI